MRTKTTRASNNLFKVADAPRLVDKVQCSNTFKVHPLRKFATQYSNRDVFAVQISRTVKSVQTAFHSFRRQCFVARFIQKYEHFTINVVRAIPFKHRVALHFQHLSHKPRARAFLVGKNDLFTQMVGVQLQYLPQNGAKLWRVLTKFA